MEGFSLNVNKISEPVVVPVTPKAIDPMATIRKELDEDLINELNSRTLKPEILLLIKLCRLLRQLRKESK